MYHRSTRHANTALPLPPFPIGVPTRILPERKISSSNRSRVRPSLPNNIRRLREGVFFFFSFVSGCTCCPWLPCKWSMLLIKANSSPWSLIAHVSNYWSSTISWTPVYRATLVSNCACSSLRNFKVSNCCFTCFFRFLSSESSCAVWTWKRGN